MRIIALLAFLPLGVACQKKERRPLLPTEVPPFVAQDIPKKREPAPLTVEIPAFRAGGRIPVEYTCDGKNVSPEVRWSGAPEGTQSFAVYMFDPDARNFVHWIVFNIPAHQDHLPRDLPKMAELEGGLRQGKNSFGGTGYGGPCPPRGRPAHRYIFRVYALDSPLDLMPGASREAFLTALQEHILAIGEYEGLYGR